MRSWAHLTAVLLASFGVTSLGVWIKLRLARARGIMDVPNARSSHQLPVPRGGGLAVIVVTTIFLVGLAVVGVAPVAMTVALVVPGVLVAGVGYVDDLRGVGAATRLLVHFIAAGIALYAVGGWQPEWVGPGSAAWYLLQVLTLLGIVWSINLFNFMDGIDGIAGSQAVFMGTAGAWLVYMVLPGSGVPTASLLMASASLGFLVWNWPPARIFMGDVGSGYLGLFIAVLAIDAAGEEPHLIFVWVVLGGAFLTDSLVTLVRRLWRRERVYEAHRTHAYQWLARRFGSHLPVTLLYTAINALWILPMAWWCGRNPDRAVLITVGALLPMIVAAIAAGAGRPEATRTGA